MGGKGEVGSGCWESGGGGAGGRGAEGLGEGGVLVSGVFTLIGLGSESCWEHIPQILKEYRVIFTMSYENFPIPWN